MKTKLRSSEQMSLGDEEPPEIDGFSRVCRNKYRDEVLPTRVNTDPHSPSVAIAGPFHSCFQHPA
jgi:hypothetical protein